MRFEKTRYAAVVRPVRWALVWQVLLAGLVAGAVVWWWNMPHGFPPSHPRFWVNQVLPFVLVGLGLTGSRAIERGRAGLCQAVLLTLPIGAAAALVAGIYLFPLSTRRFWLPGTGAVLALEFFWVWSCQPRAVGRAVVFGVGLVAAAIGVGAVYSQRGPMLIRRQSVSRRQSLKPHSTRNAHRANSSCHRLGRCVHPMERCSERSGG